MLSAFRQKRCPKPWLAPSYGQKPQSSLPLRRYYSVFNQTPLGERDRAAVGVFTPKAAALFIASGIGLFAYFRYEKVKLLEQRQKEFESKQVGRPHVGGRFKLISHDDKPFSDLDLLGRWNLLYFGFTNCPDICPAELDKMGSIVDTLGYIATEKDYGVIFQPVFISVDPARDSTPKIKRYLSDFHSRFIGLTGDYASVKSVCKAFRVYFSTPPNADPQGDYLVDHSIFIYLMDPNGDFVEAFGQATTVEDVVSRTRKEVDLWEKDRKGV